MKTKIKNAALVLAVMLGVSANFSLSHASSFGAGNGGDGVWVNGKLVVLDLAENGIEDPYFDMSFKETPEYRKFYSIITNLAGSPFDTYTRDLWAVKMAEVYKVNKNLAYSMVLVLQAYQWRLLQGELINIDDGDDVINFKSVQIAARHGFTIRIDKDLFAKMAVKQRVALITHEILYALRKPECLQYSGDGTQCVKWKQSSRASKDVNASLYDNFAIQLTIQLPEDIKSFLGFVDFEEIEKSSEYFKYIRFRDTGVYYYYFMHRFTDRTWTWRVCGGPDYWITGQEFKLFGGRLKAELVDLGNQVVVPKMVVDQNWELGKHPLLLELLIGGESRNSENRTKCLREVGQYDKQIQEIIDGTNTSEYKNFIRQMTLDRD